MKLVQKIAIAYIRARFRLLTLFSPGKAAQKAFVLFCTPQKRVRLPLSPLFKKATPCSVIIKGLDGEPITIRGFRWNEGGHPRIQIVHGFESAVQNFEAHVSPFIEKGYEVLAFDAPAHGWSDSRKITVPLYIDALRAIHENYGPVNSYLAHSFGGLALMLFVETLPNAASCRIALVAPATEAATAIDNFFALLRLSPKIRAPFDTLIERAGNAEAAHFSISRVLGNIRPPLLWIQDYDDTITPMKDVQPVIDKQYANVRFHLTRGLGHRRIYRDPEVVSLITQFI